jgi:hypothetical protein
VTLDFQSPTVFLIEREPYNWEAIMSKTTTPLPTNPQLDHLLGQFEHWRQHRSPPGERIPSHLWDRAAALAQVLPRSRVAQYLRVSPSDLNKHIATLHGSRPDAPAATPAPFIEVPLPLPVSPATAAMEIELERPDGARLRLRGPEVALPVAALVRAFLEGV